MADLDLNIQDNFEIAYKVGFPYFAYGGSQTTGSISNIRRLIGSGGNPPYAYNMYSNKVDGKLLNSKIQLHNVPATIQIPVGYADLRLSEDTVFTASDIQTWNVKLTCTDLSGAVVARTGTISIESYDGSYTMGYRLHFETNKVPKHEAYFDATLFGLTATPRGFTVVKNTDVISGGIRLFGSPQGSILISQVNRPPWLSFTKLTDTAYNYWTFSGTVDHIKSYDQIYEWEISLKDKISDTNIIEYPKIPLYICVRGTST